MPSTINRTLFEWLMVVFSGVIGTTLLLWGDKSLGVYLLYVEGINIWLIKIIWAGLLWSVAILQALAIIFCVNKSLKDGNCNSCPLVEICEVIFYRRWAAGWGCIVWLALAFSLFEGGHKSAGAPAATIIFLAEFLVFSLLSRR